MRRGFFVAAAGLVVVACAGCAADTADAETSESFVGSAGSVIGGKSGIRSVDSKMNHDAVPLSDGSAVTPVDQRYDVVGDGQRHFLYHALEFVSSAGDRAVHAESPVPFWSAKPGPDGSVLVLGFGASGKALYRVSPDGSTELIAEGELGGSTTATDGTIVWTETGASPRLHRLRNGSDTVVPLAKDPYERTFAECRTFLLADAERVYDVCISGFTTSPDDEVERIRTFAADGSLEAEVAFPKESFGGIITGFDGGGRLLVLDTAYTGDGIKNVGVHGYRYDPKTKAATVLSIPVFPRTERWRPYGIIPTPDGGCALAGNANERFGMVKLLDDGTLDRTFDEDGAMSAEGPDDWGILLSGRVSADGKRIDLLGFGAERMTMRRTYRLAVQLR